MRSIRIAVSVFACLVAGASIAVAQPTITHTPRVNPNAFRKVTVPAIPRPDFEVSQIAPIVQAQSHRMIGATITVIDRCHGVTSGSPYVTVNVTDPNNSSIAVHMGYNAGGLVGTTYSDTTTLNFSGANLPPENSIVRVTVNEDKLVPEAWSGNNARQINPNVSPFPPGKDYCKAENYQQ